MDGPRSALSSAYSTGHALSGQVQSLAFAITNKRVSSFLLSPLEPVSCHASLG